MGRIDGLPRSRFEEVQLNGDAQPPRHQLWDSILDVHPGESLELPGTEVSNLYLQFARRDD